MILKYLNSILQKLLKQIAYYDKADMLRVLLDEGVDVTMQLEDRESVLVIHKTLLHLAAGEGSIAVVQELLKHRVDINATSTKG